MAKEIHWVLSTFAKTVKLKKILFLYLRLLIHENVQGVQRVLVFVEGLFLVLLEF